MRHVRCFGRIHEQLAVWADAHSFRFDADWNFGQHGTLLDVNHGDEVVVFVRDVERISGWVENEELGIGTGRQALHKFHCAGVIDLDGIVVARANQQPFLVFGQRDPAGSLADLDSFHGLQRVAVDDGYSVILLVRDEYRLGRNLRREENAARGE